jgi:hypothetical protein
MGYRRLALKTKRAVKRVRVRVERAQSQPAIVQPRFFDDPLDQAASYPLPSPRGQDVNVPHAACLAVLQVRVVVQAAHSDQLLAHVYPKERLARSVETVRTTGILCDQPLQKVKALRFDSLHKGLRSSKGKPSSLTMTESALDKILLAYQVNIGGMGWMLEIQ